MRRRGETGFAFRQWRLSLGLRQVDVGEASGYTQVAICLIERGVAPLLPRTAVAISRALTQLESELRLGVKKPNRRVLRKQRYKRVVR